jgi:uncharacterized protein YkwD
MRKTILYLLTVVLLFSAGCIKRPELYTPPAISEHAETTASDKPLYSETPSPDLIPLDSPVPVDDAEPVTPGSKDADLPTQTAGTEENSQEQSPAPVINSTAKPKNTAAPIPADKATAKPKGTSSPTPAPFKNAYLDSMARDILSTINKHRNSNLEWSSKLETAAKERAREVDQKQSVKIGDSSKRLEELGFSYSFCSYGQLLYASYKPSEIKVNDVFNEFSGYFTDKKYSDIGIGVYHSQKGISSAFIISGIEKHTPIYMSDVEKGVLSLVNAERQKAGAAPLEWCEIARTIARSKVKEMYDNDYFAHESPYTGSLENQFKVFGGLVLGRDASYIGENLAYAKGYKQSSLTAEYWVNQWMNSKGHRENILNPAYSHMGVGIFFGEDGRAYAAQAFYKKMN